MRICEITVADEPAAWAAAGFTVVNSAVQIGESFRFVLTGGSGSDGSGSDGGGAGGGGATGYVLARAGQDEAVRWRIRGLSGEIIADDQKAPAAAIAPHANTVRQAMKAVILTGHTQSTLDAMVATIPGLGEPPVNDQGAGGEHYAIWPMAGQEVGLELVSLDPDQSDDTIAACFLVVDDLDTAIAAVGENNVRPKEVYGGREMVRIKPRTGVTPGICLIAAGAE